METKFIPKSPEQLSELEFDQLLAEYNTVKGTNYCFDKMVHHTDVWACEESTADGYSVWTMMHNNDRVSIGENVYYNEPSPCDLFNFLDSLGYGDDVINVYTDIEEYELMYYMESELVENYDNYLRELEDAK